VHRAFHGDALNEERKQEMVDALHKVLGVEEELQVMVDALHKVLGVEEEEEEEEELQVMVDALRRMTLSCLVETDVQTKSSKQDPLGYTRALICGKQPCLFVWFVRSVDLRLDLPATPVNSFRSAFFLCRAVHAPNHDDDDDAWGVERGFVRHGYMRAPEIGRPICYAECGGPSMD
jgi:hypothetical protein